MELSLAVVLTNNQQARTSFRIRVNWAEIIALKARRLTGATFFGPGIDHIAHPFAWAIERRETADTLLQLVFYHPTFEEGLRPALREICEAVKSPVLGNLDEVAAPGT